MNNRTMMRNGLRAAVAMVLVYSMMAMTAPAVMAADNTATGNIAGVTADLADSNTFTLTSQTLALIKRAFDTAGNPIASNATLPRGTQVKFMIYVNNNTAVPVSDISVQDVLVGTFAYQTNTIEVASPAACSTATCSPAEELVLFGAADGSGPLNDNVDTDVASFDGVDTIDAGNASVANAQVDVAANTAFVMVFTVTMQ